jgi:hypothetical protein
MTAVLTRLIPELALWETASERRTVLWLAWRESGGITLRLSLFSGVVTVVWFIAITLAPIVLVFCGARLLPPSTQAVVYLTTMVAFALAGAGAVLHYRRVPLIRATLRRMALEQGVSVCQVCGYDLRGISDDRCPECGTAKANVPPARNSHKPA